MQEKVRNKICFFVKEEINTSQEKKLKHLTAMNFEFFLVLRGFCCSIKSRMLLIVFNLCSSYFTDNYMKFCLLAKTIRMPDLTEGKNLRHLKIFSP